MAGVVPNKRRRASRFVARSLSLPPRSEGGGQKNFTLTPIYGQLLYIGNRYMASHPPELARFVVKGLARLDMSL